MTAMPYAGAAAMGLTWAYLARSRSPRNGCRTRSSPGVSTTGITTTILNHVLGTEINEIDFVRQWRHSTATAGTEGSDSHSGMPGDTASLRFVGTGVRCYGFADANHGTVAVSIDGGDEVVVDEYSPARKAACMT